MKRPTIEFIQALCLIQSSHSFYTPSRKQARSRLFSHRTDNGPNEEAATDEFNRRSFLKGTVQTLVSLGIQTDIATARGLARFPCKEPLLNTYHFMRAGTSLLEEENVWSTNPLFLTNREAALSEIGDLQVRDACKYLVSQGINPTVVRYSLAAASVDSANIVGEELKIGRDRLVPEFNYMDPRAIGAWDFAAYNETMAAVWAMDEKEAGPSGRGARPPPNEDGTPAETLSDQVVRLTNLVSVLETLYSGDSILLIFPDGTGPALLSCLIGGIPLNRVHEINYEPGEVRCQVDYSSVNLLASRNPPQYYLDILTRGRDQLKYLREHPDEKRNIKDLKYEEEEKLEAERKKKADAEERKKTERQIKNRNAEANQNYKASFNTEVGLVGAAILAGGIGIATLATPQSDEDDTVTQSNGLANDLRTNDDEKSGVSDADIDTTALEEAAIAKLFADEIDIMSRESTEELLEDDQTVNTSFAAFQSDLDYEESWLGAITDILNEEDLVQDDT